MTVMTRGVVTQNMTEKTRALLTRLNLYYAGVGALALVNIYLLAHMAFAWRAAAGQDANAIAQQKVAMTVAKAGAQTLEGLDGKLAQATADADKFSERRLPFAYSQVAGELGALAKKEGVKLTRVQYAEPVAVMEGSAGALTEVRLDASLSGDYRPLVTFINALERNKTFFLITGVTLTGQQSGTVNLRVRLTTYLRAPIGDEKTQKMAENAAGPDGAGPDAAGRGASR
jgi:type IV pilus assembly protein PilO